MADRQPIEIAQNRRRDQHHQQCSNGRNGPSVQRTAMQASQFPWPSGESIRILPEPQMRTENNCPSEIRIKLGNPEMMNRKRVPHGA